MLLTGAKCLVLHEMAGSAAEKVGKRYTKRNGVQAQSQRQLVSVRYGLDRGTGWARNAGQVGFGS
jgi:hypothetical protein